MPLFFRAKWGSTRTQPRLCGFSPFLLRGSKRSFLLLWESYAPPLALTLANTVSYLQENTKSLQPHKFVGFASSWLNFCVGFKSSPIFPISSCCFFVPLRDMSNTNYYSLQSRHWLYWASSGELDSPYGSNLRCQTNGRLLLLVSRSQILTRDYVVTSWLLALSPPDRDRQLPRLKYEMTSSFRSSTTGFW